MNARPRAILALTTVLLSASLALSGCSLLPHIPSLGNNGGSSDNGGSKGDDIKNNPLLGHEVPDGFPSDVPLPDLEITYSLAPTDKSWNITYQANDLQSDFASVVSSFEAAGWETQMNNANADGVLGLFAKDPYTVEIIGGPDGGNDMDGPYLSFTVVQTN